MDLPERVIHYTMKILSNARVNSMQAQIRVQALAIKFLEQDNRKQAERIAELEAVLYAAGRMDPDAFLATDEDRAWYASMMLDRFHNQTAVAAEVGV